MLLFHKIGALSIPDPLVSNLPHFQLQAKVCAQLLVNRLFKPAQEKVWLGELTVPQ